MNRQEKISLLAQYLGPLYLARNWHIALAESCSGGGIAYQITKYPGSSSWLKYSMVMYTDAAKQEILGVPADILSTHTAVSTFCAKAMLDALDINCARIAVTGYTGPDGDDVGRVYIAYAAPHEMAKILSFHFLGTREDIQEQAIFEALKLLVDLAWIWQNELKQNCFFALGIDHELTKQKICEQALKIGFSSLNLEPVSNFHLTLAHFSNQNQTDILGLIQKAEAGCGLYTTFNLSFNKLAYFDRADAWVLTLENPAEELKALSVYLGTQDLLPHLTLSKGCNLKNRLNCGEPFSILWEVASFSLFLSFHGIFYKRIKTFHLETKHDRKL